MAKHCLNYCTLGRTGNFVIFNKEENNVKKRSNKLFRVTYYMMPLGREPRARAPDQYVDVVTV